jgi:ABC-type sugar transport system permease subunit
VRVPGELRRRPHHTLTFRASAAVAMIPAILAYLLFSIAPALGTFLVSLTNYTGIPCIPVQFVGLSNFTRMLRNASSGFTASLETTIAFALSVTVIQNVAALALAVLLRNPFPLVGAFRSLIFLPAALGVTINGILWLLIFSPSQGPAAGLLAAFHTSNAFFGSPALTLPLVVFVQIWANVGFTTLVYLASMDTIPHELVEAAQIHGPGRWAVFRNVTYPLISPATTVNVLLATVGSMNVYDIIYVLTNGANNTNTLGMYMFVTSFDGSGDLGLGAAVSTWNDLIGPVVFLASAGYFPLTRGLFSFHGEYESEWTLLAAGVFIVVTPLILAFAFIQRCLVRGATAGALKV